MEQVPHGAQGGVERRARGRRWLDEVLAQPRQGELRQPDVKLGAVVPEGDLVRL
jgi:hypothetical protein